MTVKQAMLVSCEEYNYLMRGYQEELQERYNVARWTSFNAMLLSPFVKNKPRSPEQYAPFPWDRRHKVHMSHVTEAEEAELNRLKEDFIKRKQ